MKKAYVLLHYRNNVLEGHFVFVTDDKFVMDNNVAKQLIAETGIEMSDNDDILVEESTILNIPKA